MSETTRPDRPGGKPAVLRLAAASSNPGKLREYREMAQTKPIGRRIALELLPIFSDLPKFEESAPTFAENAAGKALHYSRFTDMPVVADDSGLVVDALGGAPGVYSARYAGPEATDAERIAKLLVELRPFQSGERRARFVCVVALAQRGRAIAVVSDSVQGEILEAPRGAGGFGYDPIFWVPAMGRSFAEIPGEMKNRYSHRGKAFRRLLEFLASAPVV